MTPFQTKTLESFILGHRLQKIRKGRYGTVEEFSHRSRISKQYIQAIETGRYDQLPAGFAEKFLRRYSDVLHLPWAKVRKWYLIEVNGTEWSRRQKPLLTAERLSQPPFILQKFLTRLGIGFAFLLLLGYLGFETYGTFAPPSLNIASPMDNDMTKERSIMMRGSATPESLITLNGQKVGLDERGFFTQEVSLMEGMNILRIEAKKDWGKSNIQIRKIFYYPS